MKWPLSLNEPKNNWKNMKWLVEPIGILVLHDMLREQERPAHLMRLSPIRLLSQKSVSGPSFALFFGPLILKGL